jgi:glycosyltransferase involved in cell wall biosynthesis
VIINIAASHRFHLLDLARELQDLGHDVKFYSYVPKKRVMSFGMKPKHIQSLFVPMLPFLALVRLTKGSDFALRILNLALDYAMAWFMRPCDVYIGLGTVYKKSFIDAKRKFGALTIMEWGSKHIEEQQRILNGIPGVRRQNPYFTERTKHGYDNVDYISVASAHVRNSFEDRGFSSKRIFQNPYGVDLSMFGPTTISSKPFDIIMVGGWSYRKGCDLLVEACREGSWTLLHVGPIVDLQFPTDSNMTHVDAVNQKYLSKYYRRARVFVLPSREEGLAMVQPQAVASGLPIVCSPHTGGRDLKGFLSDDKWIIEMQEYTKEALMKCIHEALDLAKQQTSPRKYSDDLDTKMSWKAYGSRYNDALTAMRQKTQ